MPRTGLQDAEPAWLQRGLDRYYTAGLAFMLVLTVLGLAFRGPGWKFTPPWQHTYIEL